MSKRRRAPAPAPVAFLGQVPRFSQPLRAPVPVAKLLSLVADAVPPDRALVASVRRFGVVTPVVLLNLNDGQGDRLVDGRRRVLAAKEAGLDHVEALIYRLDPDEGRRFPPEVLTLALNELRRPNPVAEAEAIRRLLDRGASLRDICRITGLPPARVQRRMRLLGLSAPLAEALADGRLAVGVAEAAAKLSPAEQGELADKLAHDGKLTAADVSRARDAVRRRAAQTLPGFTLSLPDAVATSPQPAKGKGTPTARDLFRALSLPLQQLVRAELAASGATWLLDAIK